MPLFPLRSLPDHLAFWCRGCKKIHTFLLIPKERAYKCLQTGEKIHPGTVIASGMGGKLGIIE